MVKDTDLLARFYENEGENKLSGNDKFLRNYILNEGWKDKGAMQEDQYHRIVDDDSEKEDEGDKFEKTYNFRFEDPTGANITSHARPAQDFNELA